MEKKPSRQRIKLIPVPVLPSEKEEIKTRAKACGMSVAAYLRTLGLNHRPKAVLDAKAVLELAKVNGDLGRLGGLLKMLLTNNERLIQRFGTKLAIQGTEKFRAQVIDNVTRANLNVTFVDPAMEEQRTARLLQQADTKTEPAIDDAITRYITERTAKRERGIAIPPHRCYEATDAGIYAYAGMRHVEGKTLMLLQTKTEILVMPLDAKTAHRLRRLRVGMNVEIKANGIVRGRGRRL